MSGGNNRAKSKKLIPGNVAICVAETVGTALLLFIGCMGCIHVGDAPMIHQMPALTFGLSVLLIIQIFGHISGSHLNPAVTIGAVYLGLVDYKVSLFYFSGQFIGAVVGFGLLKVLVPSEYVTTEFFNAETNMTEYKPGLCTTMPNAGISLMQAVAIEAIITSALVLVCCGVWDKRNSKKEDSIPLRFGLVIAALAMAAGPFTGASMNTARSFAPALLNGYWENHWIYWIGPNVGAVIGAGLYKFMWPAPEDAQEGDVEELNELAVARNNIANKS